MLSTPIAWRMAELAWRFDDRSQPLKRTRLQHGVEMELDRQQWQDRMMYYGVYERELLALLRRTVCPGNHVTDVGANVGYISLYAEKIVGVTGGVDAFEPHPETCLRLKSHIESNHSAVRVHQVALGSSSGEIVLHQYGKTTGLTSRFQRDSGISLGKTREVRCQQVRLDSIDRVHKTNFIKLDCEGSEGEVIAGAEGILTGSTPPGIYFEYSQEWTTYGASSLVEICKTLQHFNAKYRFYDLDRNLRRLDSSELHRLSGQQVANICCLPG